MSRNVVLIALAAAAVCNAKKPNLFYLLVDDLGWANVGFHSSSPEVVTPNLDALASSGAILDRFYTHPYCSPARSALQSGRAPIHVNVLNSDITQHNPSDPVSGFEGIPRNITGLAEKLKGAGYATHLAGKWHAGVATPDHTPQVLPTR
jgi:arylsulfatase I/J